MALQISVYERLSKNVLVILISISMRNFRLYQIFQISLSHMAHGYAFYESSLSHLVESLVQLPDVPWSQIQRILSLCPRVDVSPCTVSLRFARLKNSSLLRALFEVSFWEHVCMFWIKIIFICPPGNQSLKKYCAMQSAHRISYGICYTLILIIYLSFLLHM